MDPIVTTEPLSEKLAAGAYGIRVDDVSIYIGGEGVFTTSHFKLLDAKEIEAVTHVFAFLFTDMIEEYEKEVASR